MPDINAYNLITKNRFTVFQVLLDFTVQFLIEQPRDLVTFALDYFTRLHQSRRGQGAPEGIRGMGVQYSPSSAATRVSTTNSVLRPDQNHSEEDESMQSDDDISNYGKDIPLRQ